MHIPLPTTHLLALEDAVEKSLASGRENGLDVLGYGEVTLVLRIETPQGPLACKRLPLLATDEHLHAYRTTLASYVQELGERGIRVAPTEVWSTRRVSGKIAAYCIQRVLPHDQLVSRKLKTLEGQAAVRLFDRILSCVLNAVSPRVGLDAQASNWVADDGGVTYLDVTTPLLRDERGAERLDVRLFFTSLPWALRDVTRLALSRSLLDKFYSPRGVVLDLLGNLHKERLSHLVEPFLEVANRVVSPHLTANEVRAYYAEDAAMWAMLQRLRRADRWWQRTIRRRPYPFLLPGAIDR